MPRVLIVDARPDRSAALAAALAGWGCSVRLARCRASALEQAALFLPQAALVGELAGGDTPAGVAAALRALPGLHGLALVALVGPDDPAPPGGFDLLFRDPVSLDDLRLVAGCLTPEAQGGAGREAG